MKQSAQVEVSEVQVSPASGGIEQILREYKEKMGSRFDLTEKQMRRIKKKLKQEIKDWKSDTAELHSRLERWNDLMENIVESSNLPFENASNVHIPITAIYAKTYHSIERRSILGSDSIWYLQTRNENLRPIISDIDEAINYKARVEWNVVQGLSDVFWTTNRDGLGVLEIGYAIETETVQDVIYVANEDEFMEEFPSAEDSGLTDKEWFQLRMQSMFEASEEAPLEIPIEYEEIKYQGPKAEVVELADFVTFPATAKSLERRHCRGYGKRMMMRSGEIRRLINDGDWDEEEGEKILKKNSPGSSASSWDRAKDEAQGLSRTGKSDEHELFQLTYWIKLEKDEPESKLVILYSPEKDAMPDWKLFPFRMDNYVPFRIEKKPNQLIGGSIPGGIMDLNDEVDAHHNQRINSRKISEVPSFKAKKSSSRDFDPQADENLWRPGVIFWLDDPDAFQQFKVQPADFSTSIMEEKNSLSYCSLWAGVDPFIASGNAPSMDPNAPGNKTQMLIQQSNMRMDDVLSELRPSVELAGKICLSHEYQFGPPLIEFQGKDAAGNVVKKHVPKRFFRNGIDVNMHGTTVVLNPEAEFMRWFQYYAILTKEPVIAKSAKRRVPLLKNALQAGRIQGREKILPTDAELEQEDKMARAMQTAMIQAQAEKQRKKQVDDTMKAAKSKLAVAKGVQSLAKGARDLALPPAGVL